MKYCDVRFFFRFPFNPRYDLEAGALAGEQVARQQVEADAAVALAREQAARKQAEASVVIALAEGQAARRLAEASAAANNVTTNTSDVLTSQQAALVRKPLGSAGDGYSLLQTMGLENDKLTYNAIVVSDTISKTCPIFTVLSVGHNTRAVFWCRSRVEKDILAPK